MKRYGQRRLHDIVRGCYVSAGQLREWAARGVAFSVVDAKTGENISDVLLT